MNIRKALYDLNQSLRSWVGLTYDTTEVVDGKIAIVEADKVRKVELLSISIQPTSGFVIGDKYFNASTGYIHTYKLHHGNVNWGATENAELGVDYLFESYVYHFVPEDAVLIKIGGAIDISYFATSSNQDGTADYAQEAVTATNATNDEDGTNIKKNYAKQIYLDSWVDAPYPTFNGAKWYDYSTKKIRTYTTSWNAGTTPSQGRIYYAEGETLEWNGTDMVRVGTGYSDNNLTNALKTDYDGAVTAVAGIETLLAAL